MQGVPFEHEGAEGGQGNASVLCEVRHYGRMEWRKGHGHREGSGGVNWG